MAHSKEPGNVLPHEMDELTHYIFHNYSALMTLAEKAAYKALMLERKGEHSSEDMKRFLRARFGSRDSALMALLDKGAAEFLKTTRDRVLRDNKDDVFLNRCPKCRRLARTPKACLCPSCNHTWYEKRKA
jgi:ssDNA-binding Zn-finger/Zn-ribbon topoisomerase 1